VWSAARRRAAESTQVDFVSLLPRIHSLLQADAHGSRLNRAGCGRAGVWSAARRRAAESTQVDFV
jgi:hypothetical protein